MSDTPKDWISHILEQTKNGEEDITPALDQFDYGKFDYDIAELARVLQGDDQLRYQFIQYILNNRDRFTPNNNLVNLDLDKIKLILTGLQEEAVPLVQPSLLNQNFDVDLPPAILETFTKKQQSGVGKKRRSKSKSLKNEHLKKRTPKNKSLKKRKPKRV